jgi:hypothetical protein
MPDRIAELESRLQKVEERLAVLEGATGVSAYDGTAPEPGLDEGFIASASSHIGRVLLIFGGAYLLRAITDFRFVPTAVGLAMGATYALYWLFMAWRRGGTQNLRANAAFFGATSIFLALPLLVEATTKFQLLSGGQGLLSLTVYSALVMAVAVSRSLRSLGWLVTAGAIITAFALLIVSHVALPVSLYLLVLGLVSLWVVYEKAWRGLQWLGAAGADAGAIALIGFSVSEQWPVEPQTALRLAAASLVTWLASFAIRSHVRGRTIGVFEIVQSLLAAAIAFVAASLAARADGAGLAGVGLLGVVLGAASYALALSPASRRVRGVNYFYYALLGMLLVVTGSALVMPAGSAAMLWSLLALLAAWFSGRSGWVNLSLQCTLLLLAAAFGSGILGTGLQALAGGAAAGWPVAGPLLAGTALATVACLFIPVAQRSERWGTMAGLPQLIVLGLSVWEVGGLMVVYLAPVLAAAGTAEPNLAVLAALRTAILSAAAVTLALSSRFRRWPEARWLVYPLLILVGIKLFLEDFPHGQPATLFVALAFVGSALLLVARLLRREARP